MAKGNDIQEIKQMLSTVLEDFGHNLRKDIVEDIRSHNKSLWEEMKNVFASHEATTVESCGKIEEQIKDSFQTHKVETMKAMLDVQLDETRNKLMNDKHPASSTKAPDNTVENEGKVHQVLRVGTHLLVDKVTHAMNGMLEGADKRQSNKLKNAKWHHWLDTVVAVAVFASVVNLLVEMEWEASKSQAALDSGDPPHPATLEVWTTYFNVAEHVFNAIFLMECSLRVYLDRCGYFMEPLNWLDILLVGFTSVQLYILEPLDVHTSSNVSVFRVMRVALFTTL
jgi:hypothetical protein